VANSARRASRPIATIVLIVTILSGCAVVRPPNRAAAVATAAARVVRVVDGDTIKVRTGPAVETVQLLGIDTPESVKPNTPVQCFSRQASERTKALLPPGTAVRLVRDIEPRDRYGRRLAYVYWVADGQFVNLTLVREGFARPYPFAPNLAHAGELADAAARAHDKGLGLWSRCPLPASRDG